MPQRPSVARVEDIDWEGTAALSAPAPPNVATLDEIDWDATEALRPPAAPFTSRLRTGVESAWNTAVDVATGRPAARRIAAAIAPGPLPPVPAPPAQFGGPRQPGNINLASR